MFRYWKFILLITLTILMLAACSKSPDEIATDGVSAAEKVFYANDLSTNEKIAGINFYKPARFFVSDETDGQNILMTKNNESFILFINPNEDKNSRLFYDLLLNNQKKNILKIEAFEDDGEFGFAALIKNDKENVELIASVGGAKISTITKESKGIDYLQKMMEIVRSIR